MTATLRLKDLPEDQRRDVRLKKRWARKQEQNYFESWCYAAGLGFPEHEHRFHPTRRWRFDYAWPERKVALEIEGGAFTQGRHTRGAGFKADLEKYSEAAALGWRIIRVVPEDLYEGKTLDLLRRALA